MLQRVTTEEIAEMLADHRLTPWGEKADERRLIAASIGVAKAAAGGQVSGSDFVAEFGDSEQTPEQMRAALRSAAQRA